MKNNRWLLDHRRDVESQFGEDGIIEKIFEVIQPKNKWCVEFGAWDGKHYSNTYNLIQNHGWSGVLIEGDPARCAEIKQTHAGKPVHAVNAFVKDNLDELLPAEVPTDFDFLSIDIDGNDYHVWRTLVAHKPRVVIIEFNSMIPAAVDFVQKNDANTTHGNSILAMVRLAKEKGYELVCINQENAFFVERSLFPLFEIADNSIDAIKHFHEPMYIYQLYDGTIRVSGAQHLMYYGIEFDLNSRIIQPLPRFVRRMHIPWKKNAWYHTLLLRFFRRINRPRKRGPNPWDWKRTY